MDNAYLSRQGGADISDRIVASRRSACAWGAHHHGGPGAPGRTESPALAVTGSPALAVQHWGGSCSRGPRCRSASPRSRSYGESLIRYRGDRRQCRATRPRAPAARGGSSTGDAGSERRCGPRVGPAAGIQGGSVRKGSSKPPNHSGLLITCVSSSPFLTEPPM